MYAVPLHWPLQYESSRYCQMSHQWRTMRYKHSGQFWKHSSTLGLQVSCKQLWTKCSSVTSSIRRWGYSSYGLHGHQWFQHFEFFFLIDTVYTYSFKPCRHKHISSKLIVYITVDLYPHYWDFTRRCCSNENSTSCALCECWATTMGYRVDCPKLHRKRLENAWNPEISKWAYSQTSLLSWLQYST